MKSWVSIGAIALMLSGVVPATAAESEHTCALWTTMTAPQKTSFVFGWSQGVIAVLAAARLSQDETREILLIVWPESKNLDNVVTDLDVSCALPENQDQDLIASMFNVARGTAR